MNKKTVLITGASSGIGRATAIELNSKGYSVYAGARRMDKLREMEKLGIHPVQLDVADEESIVSCVNAILAKEGSIDILINNAGYGSYGAVEDVPLSEGRYELEVLLFGAARLIQLVLPKMRENHYGKIVNVTSMGGRIWTMLGAWYHAGKFAVEGFSNSLRIETKPFGIDVIVVEPGGIKTEWGDISADHLEEYSFNGAYADSAKGYAAMLRKQYAGNNLSKPELIARTISKAIAARRPRTRYLIGFSAKPMIWIKNIFGDRVFDWVIRSFSH